jgi:hypothetical protein
MRKQFLFIAFTAIAMLFFTESKAQYKNAFGVRVGDAVGVTFKTFIKSDAALDFILNIRSNNHLSLFRFTGLYEKHLPVNLEGLSGLRWYYGGGGTLGGYNYKKSDEGDLYLSVDGVIGLDYKFDGAPINLSLDWKPGLRLTPGTDFDANGIGLSVRIAF